METYPQRMRLFWATSVDLFPTPTHRYEEPASPLGASKSSHRIDFITFRVNILLNTKCHHVKLLFLFLSVFYYGQRIQGGL